VWGSPTILGKRWPGVGVLRPMGNELLNKRAAICAEYGIPLNVRVADVLLAAQAATHAAEVVGEAVEELAEGAAGLSGGVPDKSPIAERSRLVVALDGWARYGGGWHVMCHGEGEWAVVLEGTAGLYVGRTPDAARAAAVTAIEQGEV